MVGMGVTMQGDLCGHELSCAMIMVVVTQTFRRVDEHKQKWGMLQEFSCKDNVIGIIM